LFLFYFFPAALYHPNTPTIPPRASARAWAGRAARRGRPGPFHVKVDTGMGRIGMTPGTAREALPEMAADPRLRLEGVYTHLAEADSAPRVREQLALFNALVSSVRAAGLSPLFHAANSAAALLDPRTHFDLVRPGLALYGLPPAKGITGLRPVLSWKTRVVFLKTVPKGVRVSYGGTWRAQKRSRLATLPVGYADGYRRGMTGKAVVLVKGRRVPVIGRITMDQVVIDVTGLAGLDVGEEVVLLGAQGRDRLTADDLASWAGTLSYEILCGLASRVPRISI
jgi:alanine racemase